MAIKYYLQPNPITTDQNDQSARIYPNQILSTEALVAKMLKRGTSLTEADMIAVLTLFYEVITDEIADGNFINLPICNIRPGIGGVFTSAADSFDSSRHIKRASLSAGILLNRKLTRADIEKIQCPQSAPIIIEFTDINSDTVNSKLTAGGIGNIIGSDLKFDPANKEEGIFFISDEGKTTQATVIAIRTESKLLFSIPSDLAPGDYTLEVRKGFGTESITVRSGSLPEILRVS